jgi:hypothetical protein
MLFHLPSKACSLRAATASSVGISGTRGAEDRGAAAAAAASAAAGAGAPRPPPPPPPPSEALAMAARAAAVAASSAASASSSSSSALRDAAKHVSHTRFSVPLRDDSRNMRFSLQRPHTTAPQRRQWCRRTRSVYRT